MQSKADLVEHHHIQTKLGIICIMVVYDIVLVVLWIRVKGST